MPGFTSCFGSRVGSSHISYFYFIAYIPVVLLVQALPISVLGIGVRDLTFVYLFSSLTPEKDELIAAALLTLFVRVVNGIVCIVIGDVAHKRLRR